MTTAPLTSPRDRLLDGLPVQERTLDLAGIPTAVLEGGDGPPMVLLHGPGEFGAKWFPVLTDLTATHRVIAPDLPGHGNSENGDGEIDAGRMVRWLDDLIDETCDQPPVVVGHVLGGAIAARHAIAHGGKLGRLVLVDTLGLGRFRPTPGFGLALLHFSLRPNERTYERLWRRCSFDLDTLRQEQGERWEHFDAYNIAGARTPKQKQALRALMGKVGTPPIPQEQLATISVPTALIWGRHDEANKLALAEAASERYGWPLHVIERSADDPIVDQPESFVGALRRALEAS